MPVGSSRERMTWREIVSVSRATIKAASVVDGHVILAEVLDCAVRFRVVDLEGQHERIVPLAGLGTSLIAMVNRRFDVSNAFTFDFGSFRCAKRAPHDLSNETAAFAALHSLVAKERPQRTSGPLSVPEEVVSFLSSLAGISHLEAVGQVRLEMSVEIVPAAMSCRTRDSGSASDFAASANVHAPWETAMRWAIRHWPGAASDVNMTWRDAYT